MLFLHLCILFLLDLRAFDGVCGQLTAKAPFANQGNELKELEVAICRKPAQGDCGHSHDLHIFMQLTTPCLLVFATDTLFSYSRLISESHFGIDS